MTPSDEAEDEEDAAAEEAMDDEGVELAGSGSEETAGSEEAAGAELAAEEAIDDEEFELSFLVEQAVMERAQAMAKIPAVNDFI